MDHRVTDVQLLYDDAVALYNDVVCNKADTIIDNLKKAIDTLEKCWEGVDAAVQINHVIDVHNAMAKVRNALAGLSRDSSYVASKYREIQNANRAGLQALEPVTVGGEKTKMDPYVDDRDTINITSDAEQGKMLLDTVNNMYDEFAAEVNRYYSNIMSNWQMGTGRDNAESAFEEFIEGSKKYKAILEGVSQSITEALRNYQF